MAPLYGMPPDPRPRKGTPEAIVLEQLEALNAAWATTQTTQPESSNQNQPALTAPAEPQPIQRPKKEPSRSKAAARAKAAMRTKVRVSKSSTLRPASDEPESSLDRHRRKCKVCNHPQREAIEELFINWHSQRSIQAEFGIHPHLDWSSIYRHACAIGLYPKRRQNLRAVFELVLERAGTVAPTAQGIVAVVRGYTCLTDAHEWVEPERRVQITNHVYQHDVPAVSPTAVAANPVAPVSTTELPQEQSSVYVSASCAPNVQSLASVTTSNRNSPEIRIPSNSHITNSADISNRNILRASCVPLAVAEHPLSTSGAKENG